MITKIIEATNNELNWGKFMLMRPDTEWSRMALIALDGETLPPRIPLLRQIGWDRHHLWVLDLQTGEGAWFMPGGHARADLNKHRIWVCPLFEPFLEWVYEQDLQDITKLPDIIDLPNAPFNFYGYRREGIGAE